jgi:hypothetical protein
MKTTTLAYVPRAFALRNECSRRQGYQALPEKQISLEPESGVIRDCKDSMGGFS